ncbi:MAG: MotA/TolQ/ExbB proton channel family protein [Thermodesulfobacteriota bacterium]
MQKKFIVDRATAIGLVGAFAIVSLALVTGDSDLWIYLNPASFLIVVGGSIFVVLMKFNLFQFGNAFRIAFRAFFFKPESTEQLIELAISLQRKARKDGIFALGRHPIENEFFKKGTQYLMDGLSIPMVKNTMLKELYQADSRHETGRQIFQSLSEVAPAMGMIGTLIGLVRMLAHLDDPGKVGPAMAVALLTTLYGAMLGYMVAKPIASKLALRNAEERMSKMLIIDALIGIEQGIHPYILEEMLLAYLPGSQRENGGGGRRPAPVKVETPETEAA